MGFWSWLDVDEGNRRCTDGDAVVMIAACDIAITNITTTIDIDWRWVQQQVCGSHDGWRCSSGLLRMLLTTLVSVRRVCGRQITIASGSNWVRAELARRGDWAVGWSLGCGYRSGSSRRDDNFNTLHSSISAKRQLQKNLLKRKSWLKANKNTRRWKESRGVGRSKRRKEYRLIADQIWLSPKPLTDDSHQEMTHL